MEPVSAALIARNEERNIEAALQSLRWADEVVVVDGGSTDGTLEICRRYTDRIFSREWTGFVDQKNYAVAQARHDWIFSLDADERLSPELIDEIRLLRQAGFPNAGYRIPRAAFFMGRWIRHGDWYPDYQLRLFDRRRGRWRGGRVHESVEIDGTPGYLSGEIHHYTYRSLADYLRRLVIYTELAAQDYRQRGRRATLPKMAVNPAATFFKAYVLKRGFLDGGPGLMVAVMGAVSVYFKYARLYELQSDDEGPLTDHR
jgi:glycosyltransferase involved in cell wall biosynthesis